MRLSSLLTILILGAGSLLWTACPGWGSSRYQEDLHVLRESSGRLHLVATRATSTEGGPHGHTLHYVRIESGEVIVDETPGGREALNLVLDAQDRPIVQIMSAPEVGFVHRGEEGWQTIAPAQGATITEEELSAFRGKADSSWIWTGIDGITRVMNHDLDDPEVPRTRVFEIEDGNLARVVHADPPAGLTLPSHFLPDAVPDPVGLFPPGPDTDVRLVGWLVCGAAGCDWQVDPGLRIEPDAFLNTPTKLVHAGGGLPAVIRPSTTLDTEAGWQVLWPGGNTWLDIFPRIPDAFRVASRPGGGFVLANYRGHDERVVDLYVFEADFTYRTYVLDLEGRTLTELRVLVDVEAQDENVRIFYPNGMTVNQDSLNLRTQLRDTTRFDL